MSISGIFGKPHILRCAGDGIIITFNERTINTTAEEVFDIISSRGESITQTPNASPCPKCGSPVIVIGSECYPEDGFCVECSKEDCTYEMNIDSSYRSDRLRRASVAAHNSIKES